jgi:hypothetical protein
MNAVAAIPLDDALRAMVQSASGPEDALEWWNLIRAAHHGEGVRWWLINFTLTYEWDHC